MPHSHAKTAAAGSPPPDGPWNNTQSAFHNPKPPSGEPIYPYLPEPIVGHEYNVSRGPEVHQIDHSLNFGDALSEEQDLVTFEIEGIGRVHFGLTGKRRMYSGSQYWEITGLTAEFSGGIHVGIFQYDIERKIGTARFAR